MFQSAQVISAGSPAAVACGTRDAELAGEVSLSSIKLAPMMNRTTEPIHTGTEDHRFGSPADTGLMSPSTAHEYTPTESKMMTMLKDSMVSLP